MAAQQLARQYRQDRGGQLGRREQHRRLMGDAQRDMCRKTELCRYFSSRGGCNRGGACQFAHGSHEIRSKPDLSKTSLCKLWAQGRCPYVSGRCPWAHGDGELRPMFFDDGSTADQEDEIGAFSSEAVRMDQEVRPAALDVRQGGFRSRTDGQTTVDILLEALTGEADSPSSHEEAVTFCPEPVPQHAAGKECPRCRVGGQRASARFCVHCGYALVEPQVTPQAAPLHPALAALMTSAGAAPWPASGSGVAGVAAVLLPVASQDWISTGYMMDWCESPVIAPVMGFGAMPSPH